VKTFTKYYCTELGTPEGLEQLVACGELTVAERDSLLAAALPSSQYAFVLLEWWGLRVFEATERGVLNTNNALEGQVFQLMMRLRANFAETDNLRVGRLPFQYVHIVQLLVDSLLVVAPFALWPKIGAVAVVLSAGLTFFYAGLLELGKSFLDPYGVEGTEQNIRIDTLMSEVNFGALRWTIAGSVLPEQVRQGP